MPFLVSVVLFNVVKVIAANGKRALHLRRLDDARQNFTADRHVAGKWTLLVDEVALDGFARCLRKERVSG